MLTSFNTKVSPKYSCIHCDYNASRLSQYNKHILTAKHMKLTSVNQKVSKQYCCECCNYETTIHSNYKKHLLTEKHLKVSKVSKVSNTVSQPIMCDICNKIYNSRVGLWQHKKKCSQKPIENTVIPDTPNTVIDVSLIMSLVKDNKDFTKQMLDNQNVLINKVIELSREPNTVNNTNCNNTNNNNHFNLNLFLNETCKDAINITDFVKTIVSELQLEDLEETARLGYVAGISRIFVNALSNLEVNKRPIHCTDIKRETVYIKDEDKWEKENPDKQTLKNVVDYVADANMRQINDWKEENPNWTDNESQEGQVLNKIYMATIGGGTDEEDNKYMKKIIKNVLQEVVVEKEGE